MVIAGGFYYYGVKVNSDDPNIVASTEASMFGEFSGEKGMPEVARGDSNARVTLDRFDQDAILGFPIASCYSIVPSIDLYKFKGTTIR